MKKTLLLLLSMLFVNGLIAQNQQPQEDNKVVEVICTSVGISKPLSDLFIENHASENLIQHKTSKESEDRLNRIPQTFLGIKDVDPVVQTKAGFYQAKSLVDWEGQSDGTCPPDPTGGVGTNYYVQSVNGSSGTPIKIYNKTTGGVIGTIADLASLWGNSYTSGGDPIVLYDKFADRWFLSQFDNNANITYIAVSTTNNPAGTYRTFSFTSPQFPDFQKFSIWVDGYYMTSNQHTQKIWVFQRDVMLAASGTPKGFYKTFTVPHTTSSFFCPLPSDADGQLPALGEPCPILSYEDNGWGSGYVDRININNVSVNWTPTTPTATIVQTQLASAPFDAQYNFNWNDISQPGTLQKLDGIGGVLNFRAQHRVWTGYNSIVVCMGVYISSTQRGIRWYELRKPTSGTWSIYQQGTYAPADGLSRWCGSIAMDDNGSIGMAYAVSGSGGTGGSVYPGIRYTGRRSIDSPLGEMSFAETTAIAGTASITFCGNRFGDYSHTSLDPVDGVTFWHTGEYGSGGGDYSTRIFSFQIPLYVGIEEEKSQSISGMTVYQSGFDLMVKTNNLPSNNQMVVDLFDINGKKINGNILMPVDNKFETSFNVNGLAAGTYLVRVGEPNTSFQKVIKVVIE